MMPRSNCVLIQQASGEHMQLLDLTHSLHSRYCQRHCIDFWSFYGSPRDIGDRRDNWQRVKLMQDAQAVGYEFIVWLDADCLIVGDRDLREACMAPGFNMTWHDMSGWGDPAFYDHWNTGAIYGRDEYKCLASDLQEWWQQSDEGHGWADQHAFNVAAPHAFFVKPNRIDSRWNSVYPEFMSPDPVVIAWHGYGAPELRAGVMAEEIVKRFGAPFPKSVPATTPADRYVHAKRMAELGHADYAQKEMGLLVASGDIEFTTSAPEFPAGPFVTDTTPVLETIRDSISSHEARGDRFDTAKDLYKSGDKAGAESELRAILAERPDEPEVLRELGQMVGARGEVEEAEKLLLLSSAYEPNVGATWCMLGACASGRADYQRAAQCYDLALHFSPDMPLAHRNRALNRLMLGDFEAGFEEDFRWGRIAKQRRLRFPAETEWGGGDGAPIRRILVWSDQGAGDVMQNARHLMALRAKFPSMRIIWEVHDGLVSLAQRSGLADEVVKLQLDGGMPIPFDAHVELGDLPHFLGLTTPEKLTITEPYLKADPAKIAEWRGRIVGAYLKVGFVYKGNPLHPNDKNRSMAFEQIKPILAVRGIASWDLSPRGGTGLKSWDDTAAIIELLDVVVAVDTGLCHLAGALGATCIALLPFAGDWRWGPTGDETFWYPSMSLVRQPKRGDWATPVAQVAEMLKGMVGDEFQAYAESEDDASREDALQC